MKEQRIVVCIGGKPPKIELDILNLSEEQKIAYVNLGKALNQIRAVMDTTVEELSKRFEQLTKQLKTIEFEPELERKTKNWNKKRFYG